MSTPLVSIVVPVYNMGDSIEKCVQSLISQDYENLEIILVDDGSKDDSLARCLRLQQENPVIQVYHTENHGSGPARNYGIERSSGEYIFFPDADDKLGSTAISTLVRAMSEEDCDLVVFGYRSIDNKGKCILKKTYPEMICTGNNIRNNYSDYMGSTRKYGIQGAPWNKFFDLNVIKENNVKYPPLRRHQDEGFIAKYMCYAKKVHFIPNAFYEHSLNDLRKEWDKYPVDYIDVVAGLYETRKDTILTWNTADTETRNIVQREYICNVIKALELSFSPKMKFDSKERKKWILRQIDKYKLGTYSTPGRLGKYQKIVFSLLKRKEVSMALLIMRLKVEVEKKGLLHLLRG